MPAWLAPLLITAGGTLLSSVLGNRNKNQGPQVQPGTPLYDWLTSGMLPASGGGGGGPITTTRNETQTRNLLTMPVISSEFQPIVNLLNQQAQHRLRFPQQVPQEYLGSQLRQINDTFGVLEQALGNRLSALGQSSSPAAGVPAATLMGQKGRAVVDARAQIPVLARQWAQEDATNAANLAANFGRGQRETGTIRTSGTSTSSGGGGGGGGPRFDPSGPLQYLQMQQQAANRPGFFDQILPMLGYMIGAGLFGGGGGSKSTAVPPPTRA